MTVAFLELLLLFLLDKLRNRTVGTLSMRFDGNISATEVSIVFMLVAIM